jgi:hypothetical protein
MASPTTYSSMENTEKLSRLSSIVVTGLSALVKTTVNIGSSDAATYGFLAVACAIAEKLIEHGYAVGENDLCVKEAGRRGDMVQTTLKALKEAEFPSTHPAFSAILETLAELNEMAKKWGDKGYWSKRLGVSFSKCTTKALKYKQLFALQFQVRFIVQIMITIRKFSRLFSP